MKSHIAYVGWIRMLIHHTLKAIVIFMLAMIISCTEKERISLENHSISKDTQGLKIIENKSIPSVDEETLNIDVKKIKEIKSNCSTDRDSSFNLFWLFSQNKYGNYFFVDQSMESIIKFDSDFNFEKKILKKGLGPGELEYGIGNIFTNCDTLYVFADWKLKYFNFDGEFIKEKLLTELFDYIGETKRITVLKNNNIIHSYNSWEQDEKKKTVFVEKLSILDQNFNVIKNIKKFSSPYERDKPLEGYLSQNNLKFEYAVGDSEIYVAEKSTEKYFIEVYDLNGEKKYSFSKKFRKISYSKYESKLINANINKYIGVGGSQGMHHLTFKNRYKNIIRYLYNDKYGRIWVEVSTEDKGYNPNRTFDIFKEGVYLTTYQTNCLKSNITNEFPLDSGIKDIIFLDGEIIYTNFDFADSKVELFSY